MREDELARYRETLLRLRSRLTGESRRALGRVADKGSPRGELSRVPTHPADRDSEGLQRDIALEATREQMLEATDRALERMEEGDFGRCAACGRAIPAARLRALPFAARCVECEEKRMRGSESVHPILAGRVPHAGSTQFAPNNKRPTG